MHLELQEWNAHHNDTTHSVSRPLGSFYAAKRRIHDAVVCEFGNWGDTDTVDPGTTLDEIELADRCPTHTARRIDLDEFPWVGRSSGERETA